MSAQEAVMPPQQEQVAEQPLEASARFDQLMLEVTPLINTGLNEKISNENEAAAAHERVTPLMVSQDFANLSDELRRHASGASTAELSEPAKAALETGETPESLMDRAEAARDDFKSVSDSQNEELGFDEKLDETRDEYVHALMKYPKLRGRKAHKEKLANAEATYNEALLAKIAAVMDLDSEHKKNPYAPPTARDLKIELPNAEQLSGNQLHLLVDQLAKEKVYKSEAIEALTNTRAKRVLKAFTNSRVLRIAVGGAILAGGMVADHKGLLPEGIQSYAEHIDKVLPAVAGYFTGREVVTGVDEGLTKRFQSRKTKRDMLEITSSTLLSERALRTVYSDIEYYKGRIRTRSVGENPEENQKIFKAIDSEFTKLEREGYRGGKPYKAEQVLPYVADLYLRRKEQVDGILTAKDPKDAFLGLCQEVIKEDTAKITEGQRSNRRKRVVSRALAVSMSVFANQWVGQLSDAQGASMRPVGMMRAEAA